MRAYIHAFQGRPWNEECRAAYEGFHKLGIETVLFTTNEEFDTRNPEDVVVGGTVIVWHGRLSLLSFSVLGESFFLFRFT